MLLEDHSESRLVREEKKGKRLWSHCGTERSRSGFAAQPFGFTLSYVFEQYLHCKIHKLTLSLDFLAVSLSTQLVVKLVLILVATASGSRQGRPAKARCSSSLILRPPPRPAAPSSSVWTQKMIHFSRALEAADAGNRLQYGG